MAIGSSVNISGNLVLNTQSVNAASRQVQQALGRITGQASEFQKSLDASTARVFAFGATTSIISGVGVALSSLVSSSIEVEKKLMVIQTILQTTSENFNVFRETIFSAAQATGQSFDVAADAAAELARQGLNAEDTAKRLQAALVLTRISGLDSASSVKALTAAINGFTTAGLTAEQITNKLVAVDTKFAVSAKDLAEGFSRSGSTAEDAGVSFDELLGIITAVEQRTSRGGAVIGNALKSIFSRLGRSTTIDDLKSLGVEIDSSQSGIEKLKALSSALEKVSDPTVASQIKELAGGVYQINVVSAALKDLGSDTSIFAKAAATAASATNEAFVKNSQLNETISAQMNSLVVGLTNLSEKIGSVTFGPILKDLLGIANKLSGFLNEALDPEKGNAFVKGLFKAIGAFLSGPAIVLFTGAFLKIFSLITKFAKDGFKSILEIGSQTEKLKGIEAGLVDLLSRDKNLRDIIASTTATQAQKEQAVILAIQKENQLLTQQEVLLRSIANLTLQKGVTSYSPAGGFQGKKGKRFASGFMQEEFEARSLGATPSVKAKMGKGTIGGQKFIMNNQETEIPNFGKNGDSAVIPHYAKGAIPNFAKYIYDSDRIAPDKNATLKAILASKAKKNLIVGPAGSGKSTFAAKGGKFLSGVLDVPKTGANEIDILSSSARAKDGGFSKNFQEIISSVNASGGKVSYLYAKNLDIINRRAGRTDASEGDLRSQKQLKGTKFAPLNQFDFISKIKSGSKSFGLLKNAAQGFIPNFAVSVPVSLNTKTNLYKKGTGTQGQLSPEQEKHNKDVGAAIIQARGDKKNLTNIRKKAEVDTSPIDANKILGNQMPRIFTPLESGRVSKTVAKGSKLGYPDLDTKFNFRGVRAKTKNTELRSEFSNFFDKDGEFVKFADNTVLKFARSIASSFSLPPVDPKTVADLTGVEGFKGAIRGAMGAIFDKAISSAVKTNADDNIEGDFDINARKGGLENVEKVFGKGSLPDSKLADLKIGIGGESPNSMAKKTLNTSIFKNLLDAEYKKRKTIEKNKIAEFEKGQLPTGNALAENMGKPRARLIAAATKTKKTASGFIPNFASQNAMDAMKRVASYQGSDPRLLAEKKVAIGKLKKLKSVSGSKILKKQEFLNIFNSQLDSIGKGYINDNPVNKLNSELNNGYLSGALEIDNTKLKNKISAFTAAKGFVPNFADPLKNAISREVGAGVNPSQVYIDQNSSLRNSGNPMGLMVANRRDEPQGGFQGINRAKKEGANIKTYGMASGFIPNFAPAPLSGAAPQVLPALNQTNQQVQNLGSSFAKTQIIFGSLQTAFYALKATFPALEEKFPELTNSVGTIITVLQTLATIKDLIPSGGGGGGGGGGALGKGAVQGAAQGAVSKYIQPILSKAKEFAQPVLELASKFKFAIIAAALKIIPLLQGAFAAPTIVAAFAAGGAALISAVAVGTAAVGFGIGYGISKIIQKTILDPIDARKESADFQAGEGARRETRVAFNKSGVNRMALNSIKELKPVESNLRNNVVAKADYQTPKLINAVRDLTGGNVSALSNTKDMASAKSKNATDKVAKAEEKLNNAKKRSEGFAASTEIDRREGGYSSTPKGDAKAVLLQNEMNKKASAALKEYEQALEDSIDAQKESNSLLDSVNNQAQNQLDKMMSSLNSILSFGETMNKTKNKLQSQADQLDLAKKITLPEGDFKGATQSIIERSSVVKKAQTSGAAFKENFGNVDFAKSIDTSKLEFLNQKYAPKDGGSMPNQIAQKSFSAYNQAGGGKEGEDAIKNLLREFMDVDTEGGQGKKQADAIIEGAKSFRADVEEASLTLRNNLTEVSDAMKDTAKKIAEAGKNFILDAPSRVDKLNSGPKIDVLALEKDLKEAYKLLGSTNAEDRKKGSQLLGKTEVARNDFKDKYGADKLFDLQRGAGATTALSSTATGLAEVNAMDFSSIEKSLTSTFGSAAEPLKKALEAAKGDPSKMQSVVDQIKSAYASKINETSSSGGDAKKVRDTGNSIINSLSSATGSVAVTGKDIVQRTESGLRAKDPLTGNIDADLKSAIDAFKKNMSDPTVLDNLKKQVDKSYQDKPEVAKSAKKAFESAAEQEKENKSKVKSGEDPTTKALKDSQEKLKVQLDQINADIALFGKQFGGTGIDRGIENMIESLSKASTTVDGFKDLSTTLSKLNDSVDTKIVELTRRINAIPVIK